MRGYLILFFLFLFDINISFSQNTVSIGLKSSYNSSNINFYNNFFPQNIKTNSFDSYNFSFVTVIKNSKNTGIRIEISKIMKGWVQDYIIVNSFKSEFTYLNIPLMMTTYFGTNKTKINFSLGPYAEIQIDNNSQNLRKDYPDLSFYFDESRDNKFGYGLVANAGLSFDLNKSSFQVLVSYQYNFDNLIDLEQKSSIIPDISNFNTLSISFVYLFNFLKKNEL